MPVPVQVVNDLKSVFDQLPVECLLNLQANRHRLVRGVYRTKEGRGCLFNLLTELLSSEQRISSRASLIRYFGGDPDAPAYQPAKWLVRLWDGRICSELRDRYGDCTDLDEQTVFEVLERTIHDRTNSSEVGAAIQIAPPHSSAESAIHFLVDLST